ncbi:hypothetical protein WA026_020320 [Henosepilachna vigintioctopunctata]|uniref:Uncharacterized protein n=1 Tax=Henosepilachna vigintioctopunctata TaxID=420089 RepID=A0AAW1TXY7_9CUCU
MIDNKEYYLKLPNVNPDFFKPRSEALKYIQRKTYEDKLLKYIEKEFQADKLVVEDFSKNYLLNVHNL